MEEIVRAHIWISGRVQGVFFRAQTDHVANCLGIKGLVRNLLDGRVEVIAQGTKDKVDELIKWCKKGPPHAKVTQIKIHWEQPDNKLKEFKIAYTTS
jgi:acylphosphatase